MGTSGGGPFLCEHGSELWHSAPQALAYFVECDGGGGGIEGFSFYLHYECSKLGMGSGHGLAGH